MVIFLKIVLYIISCLILNLLIPRMMNYLAVENYDIIDDANNLLDNIFNNESEKSLIFVMTRIALKVISETLKSVIDPDLNIGIKIVSCLLCIYMIPFSIITSIIMDILIMFIINV